MAESPDSRSLVSASSQLNLMEIEAIDDKEFDIPQVDTPPTLESILNEPEEEDEPFILEDTCLLNTENIDAHSCETSSLASSDSGDRTHLKRRRKAVETNATVHGSVLRRNLLKGISAQIVSAADKVDAGLPTAITVSNVIAVGTSHGLALVFGKDQNQALRLCLGTTATGAEYGAVSALSINHDCTRLLCGFAKGQITMWDLANGKLLRTITDAHPPGTAILHVKFTDHPALAVCNDSGGSVFELSFRRVMGMRTCESRCLFSGSKGEVCCVEPLHAGPELKDHPITHYSLLAMASLTKILLIGLKPSLKVWMTFPYGKTDPASVPLLAWQFVAVQKTINPVLAFCRGDTIHFLLVKKDESGTIHVIKQRQLQLNCDLISLSWINPRTLVLMDSTEKLRVVDRPSQEELETVDMAELQLVYNSSHFKSLATGGNVSQALALVGEKTCYQSVCSYAGQIMYLGTKSVHIMTLRNWRERVDHLLKQEKFMEALSLAWSFHEGTGKAVLGLFADPAKRKGVVADKMVEILLQYVDRSLKKCPEQGKIQVMEQHFQDMVPVTVDYCLLLQRTDLLFNQIYPRLVENSVARGVFLESLEPYILSERIGCLTAPVMRDLLSYFQENGMMDSVEGCLVHMDITNLDIQQVVQMCWDNQLYDAMIYVFNSGMNDYISPMEDLVSINSAKTAELVAVHFADQVQPIITSLQDDCLAFQFLKCLLNPSSRESLSPQTVLKLGPDLHELLVDLLCQFSPQQVIAFLKTSQDYRLEEAIQITAKHKLHEATAYLLEKKGDVQGAFEVLLQTLKGKLHKLALEGSETDKPDGEGEETGDEVPSLLQRVEEALHDIIALCQRSSHGLNQQQREALWFPLLEAMMSPQKLLKGANTKHTSEALKELTMKVLNSMSSFIAPPAIIQRILQDPVYGKGKLAEIQGLILGMLETFNYEQTLLETTTNLLNSDLHWSLSHLRKAVSRGLHPRQDHCNICLQQYKRRQESEEEIIIFSCGHLYHCQCLQRKEVGVLSERQYSWSCYKCTSNQGTRPADRPSAESSRSCSTSLAQTKVMSTPHGIVAEAHGRKMLTEATLDAQQTQAWDHFRTLYRGPSRLAVLTELTHSHGSERAGLSNPVHPGTGSIYHSENVQLKLSPPPLVEE
ncbi:vacuolar protein sorting-associated protein 8 homolog [Sinocyclocheilus grahami]|uniref:vacuolar protein sorting-associated protein 8 homolog n=1 Tax=Sinocyclocheilus grahami TaxID=75366 RepID=UPI0007ACD715|nr:PREDICTED: vacuolar protein sorting-associated protein 8 homolog [Sinocyclocheilus grahami]